MSAELTMLHAFCLDKKYYKEFNPYISAMSGGDRVLATLFRLVQQYYDKYSNQSDIELVDFKEWYDYCYPNSRDRDIYMDMLDAAFKEVVQHDLMRDILEQYMERFYSNRLMNKLMPVLEGNKSGVLHETKAIIEEYTSLLKNPPEELQTITPLDLTTQEICDATVMQQGYPFPFPKLNEIIGGIPLCSNGMIYGYTNAGKTSLALKIASLICDELKDTDDIVLYLGNEETAVRTANRAQMAWCGFDKFQLREPEYVAKTEKIKAKTGWDRFKICDGVHTGEQILKLMDEWRPKVVIIDVATDVVVKVQKRLEEGANYGQALFKWYRTLGNDYECAVISIAQAGVEGEDNRWVKLSDLYGSKSGIQTTLDWAIGMGKKLNDLAQADTRWLGVTKNKYGDEGRLSTTFFKSTGQWEENAGQ